MDKDYVLAYVIMMISWVLLFLGLIVYGFRLIDNSVVENTTHMESSWCCVDSTN